MPEPDYSEKIEFSRFGIRMAVLEPNGRLTHLDNWELDMFGGVLPAAGDHVTTLWDTQKPEPAESYIVVERHWLGELMGDNCWWLLLKPADPTPTHRRLFDLARQQSAETRRLNSGATYGDLVELRKAMDRAKAKVGPKKPAKRPSRQRPNSQ